jgi:NAD(P)-dependent dehydrogenase (short-subunit alcohol dehydrogenase family)
MHLFIITGTSRGIGAALAKALIGPQHSLLCISRSENPDLRTAAEACGCPFEYVSWDLSQTEEVGIQFNSWLENRDFSDLSSMTFVQNAGVLSPIQPIRGAWSSAEVQYNLAVNLQTPMVMAGIFAQQVQELDIPRRILNISSGAGRRPIAGWSAYCTAKAGLDMFSRCLATEQADQPHPIGVVSLAPGTVDTAMQEEIRGQDEATFPNLQRFLDLKSEGKLWSLEKVAKGIVDLLQDPDFGEPVMQDLRDRLG